jgi:XTP/dITP diphosphohydrolase/ATP diphosphatase
VFGDVKAADAGAVLRNWEQIKQTEKRAAGTETSGLDGIPRTMPAMLEAAKLGSRAAKVGFDWPDAEGLFAKLQEEIAELGVEVGRDAAVEQARVEEEMGDLLFTVVNLARHLRVDTESALRGANAKFRRRFGAMEASVGGFEALGRLTPEELERLWDVAKRETTSHVSREAR